MLKLRNNFWALAEWLTWGKQLRMWLYNLLLTPQEDQRVRVVLSHTKGPFKRSRATVCPTDHQSQVGCRVLSPSLLMRVPGWRRALSKGAGVVDPWRKPQENPWEACKVYFTKNTSFDWKAQRKVQMKWGCQKSKYLLAGSRLIKLPSGKHTQLFMKKDRCSGSRTESQKPWRIMPRPWNLMQ